MAIAACIHNCILLYYYDRLFVLKEQTLIAASPQQKAATKALFFVQTSLKIDADASDSHTSDADHTKSTICYLAKNKHFQDSLRGL